jgi:hypothetical protein
MNHHINKKNSSMINKYKGLNSLKIIGVIDGGNYVLGMTSEEY